MVQSLIVIPRSSTPYGFPSDAWGLVKTGFIILQFAHFGGVGGCRGDTLKSFPEKSDTKVIHSHDACGCVCFCRVPALSAALCWDPGPTALTGHVFDTETGVLWFFALKAADLLQVVRASPGLCMTPPQVCLNVLKLSSRWVLHRTRQTRRLLVLGFLWKASPRPSETPSVIEARS